MGWFFFFFIKLIPKRALNCWLNRSRSGIGPLSLTVIDAKRRLVSVPSADCWQLNQPNERVEKNKIRALKKRPCQLISGSGCLSTTQHPDATQHIILHILYSTQCAPALGLRYLSGGQCPWTLGEINLHCHQFGLKNASAPVRRMCQNPWMTDLCSSWSMASPFLSIISSGFWIEHLCAERVRQIILNMYITMT